MHSLAANPLIRCSPAPETQQPAINGAPKGPFDDAQQPEPYIAASPTRPLTCWIFYIYNYEQSLTTLICKRGALEEKQTKKTILHLQRNTTTRGPRCYMPLIVYTNNPNGVHYAIFQSIICIIKGHDFGMIKFIGGINISYWSNSWRLEKKKMPMKIIIFPSDKLQITMIDFVSQLALFI